MAYFAAQSSAAKDNNLLKASPFRLDRILATAGEQGVAPKSTPSKSHRHGRTGSPRDALASDLVSIVDDHETESAESRGLEYHEGGHQTAEPCTVFHVQSDDNPFIASPCLATVDATCSEPPPPPYSYLTKELAEYHNHLDLVQARKRAIALE